MARSCSPFQRIYDAPGHGDAQQSARWLSTCCTEMRPHVRWNSQLLEEYIVAKNVLFILADQFRADCLGAAGNEGVKTPNLDRLAAQGALCELL